VQLTVAPTYSVLRLGFLGRPAGPIRGAGVGAELDVRIVQFLWLRVQGGTAWHAAAKAVDTRDPENPELTAASGAISVTEVGGSLVVALDLGRVVPLVDAGLGGLWIHTPKGVTDGQAGMACRSGGQCDVGLHCGADDVCRPAPQLEVHVGLAIDVPIGRFLSLGAHFRYHVPARELTIAPLLLTGALRLGVRF
jgi:hypothetical protein